MLFTRRQSLGLLPGLMFPICSFAQSEFRRKFIFICCEGGWDPTVVFAPLFNNSIVDMESFAQPLQRNGIDFVGSSQRPAVTEFFFFETWGDRALVVNGIDYETVAHDRGLRMMFTGASNGREDWGSILSSLDERRWTAPHLVISGPTYATDLSPAVVRIGAQNQLRELLRYHDDNDLVSADRRASALVDAYLAARHSPGDPESTDASLRFVGGMARAQTQIRTGRTSRRVVFT